MQQTVRSPRWGSFPAAGSPATLSALAAVACVTVALTGCSGGEDVMTTAAPPHGAGAQADAQAGTQAEPGKPDPAAAAAGEPDSSNLVVTDRQRDYLDALAAAGVHRSSDLMALSIGSYICQARAAGQNNQAVWDFVFPMVRGDVHDMDPKAAGAAMATQVDDATAAYIYTATNRLC